MKKTVLLASLLAAIALTACGKKEEAAAPAAAPAVEAAKGRRWRRCRCRQGCWRCRCQRWCRRWRRCRCGCCRRRWRCCRCRQGRRWCRRRRRQGWRRRCQGSCRQGRRSCQGCRQARSVIAQVGSDSGPNLPVKRNAALGRHFFCLRGPLLQISGQQLDDALSIGRGVGLSLGIQHGHRGIGAAAAHGNPVLHRLGLGGRTAEKTAEKAGLGRLGGGVCGHVANEIHALAAIAVLDGENRCGPATGRPCARHDQSRPPAARRAGC